VAIENKLDHDRKLQNIYEKSLRHYHDISQISSLMKNQLETSNYNKAHDFNLRENRSQEELTKYHLSGSVLPRIGGAGNDDVYSRYKHKPRIQLKDRLREQELLGSYEMMRNKNKMNLKNGALNANSTQRNTTANKNYLLMQQYATHPTPVIEQPRSPQRAAARKTIPPTPLTTTKSTRTQAFQLLITTANAASEPRLPTKLQNKTRN